MPPRAAHISKAPGSAGGFLLADSGVENVNDAVDGALAETGIKRLVAQVEITWSNSMIEAIRRKLKYDWLFLNQLDSLATVERLAAFYVEQHNTVMPQVALRRRTPDEVFRGEANDLSERLCEAHHNAMRDRIETNRALACGDCPLPLREETGSSLIPAEGQKVE
jgi:transposase InsO family protein